MRLHKHLMKSLFGKAALATAALGGLFLFAGAPNAQASDRYDCNRAIRYSDHRLHEAVERHGYYSREANHWRHERNEAYERCWRDRNYDRHYDRDYRW